MYFLATLATAAACAVLMYLILTHDFRVAYVFGYSDVSLPIPYLVSSFWAGQEGSLLLWVLLGFLLGLPLIRHARHYENRALLVFTLTLVSLLAILLRQSPFAFLADLPAGQAPLDGQGLNPLLQNPWMTVHPPVMFLGYAATAVPFALAVAALWERRYEEWVRVCMPWALLSLVTMGAGIVLGGYWAYITLGWGGYWAWDPVENASLVPWLTSIALVHCLLLQRARGRFRKLNFSLALLTYVLVVYATFLTRSGVVADFSVHSFVDLGISGWLVAKLLLFLAGGFAFLAWRWKEIPARVCDEPALSRTWLLVLATAALLGGSVIVLVGTSAPLLTTLVSRPSGVSPEYYTTVMQPIGIGIALLLGLVPYLHWRGTHTRFRSRSVASGALAAVATVSAIAAGARGWVHLLLLFAAFLVVFANLLRLWDEIRSRMRPRAVGGYLAHVGLGLMLSGIVTSSAWDRGEKVELPLGEPRQVLGHTVTFRGVSRPPDSAREMMLVEVSHPRHRSYMARPRMFRSPKTNQVVANPHVRARLTHDIYVSPIEFNPGRSGDMPRVLDLTRGETRQVSSLAFTFTGFDLPGTHGEEGQVSIGAVLEVTGPEGRHQVTAKLASTTEGFQAIPISLPGTEKGVMQLVGVNAGSGIIRLHIDGLASAPAMRTTLNVGGEIVYRELSLTLAAVESRAGGVVARLSVSGPEGAADPELLETAVIPAEGGGHRHQDAPMPGMGNVVIRLEHGDPGEGLASLAVLDPDAGQEADRPMAFVADVAVKPMINLLWSGLVLMLAGSVLALIRRGREFSSAVGTHLEHSAASATQGGVSREDTAAPG